MTDYRTEQLLAKWFQRRRRSALMVATLGHPDGVSLWVPGRSGFVYARVEAPTGISLWEVRCTKLTARIGLKALLETGFDGQWEVAEQEPEAAATYFGGAGAANVGPHWATSHGYAGSDPALLDGRQLMTLRVYPTDTPSLTVNVGECLYFYGGSWQTLAATTLDLSAKVPTGAQVNQCVIIVGIDGSAGTLTTVDGTATLVYAASTQTVSFTLADVLTVLASAAPDFIPAAAVRLYGGQTTIQAWDIFKDAKGLAGGGPRIGYSTNDVSDPPTASELNSAFGTASSLGLFIGLVNDNNEGTKLWLCASDGTDWWTAAMTKAL